MSTFPTTTIRAAYCLRDWSSSKSLKLHQPIPARDLMQDMKTVLKTEADKTEGPDAAPVRRGSADEALPVRVVPGTAGPKAAETLPR